MNPSIRLAIAIFLMAPGAAFGQEDAVRGGPGFREAETSRQDQTDVAVTVYNNNLALVRDTRTVSLPRGEISLLFMDVAQQIIPETVSLRAPAQPKGIRILEQNYEFDLMSPSKLMEKYVGQTVRLINFSNEIGFTEIEAELLSIHEGPIYRVGDEIFIGHPGTVVLPKVPENLIAKPSLVWLLDNEVAGDNIEVTYLTRGLSWRADYVIHLNREEDEMDMNAWVTLNNQSGAPYVNAKLKLVAGDVNIVRDQFDDFRPRRGAMKAVAMAEAMVEEAFAEYHLYTLPRRTTIKENQSKQVSLFSASKISVEKEYEFRGNMRYYSQKIPIVQGQEKVSVFLKFENEESNNLGIPLPAGIMRIYQEDSEGMLQFSGEDRIRHTPKDEKIRLRLGNAFDIVGERVQTDFSQIAQRVTESSFEVTLRNHKDRAVRVDVVEPMMGDWTVLKSSHPHEKRDARTAVFPLTVDADGETVLTYRMRVRY